MKLMRRAEDRERAMRERHMRRGMYVLPSLFTAGNIGLGYYSITQALQGSLERPLHFKFAALAIGFAVVFDGIDGFVARMTKTESEFGKELDSLADVITFGVAPAILAYVWGFKNLPYLDNSSLHEIHAKIAQWGLNGLFWLDNQALIDVQNKIIQFGAVATFLFLIAGASRLARFNISKNPQPTNPGRPGRKYFVGMPIPAGAGVIASLVYATDGAANVYWWVAIAWMFLVTFVGFLMVSRWRFFSLKGIDLGIRRPMRLIFFVAPLIAAIVIIPNVTLPILALGYMLSGIFSRASYFVSRRHAVPGEGAASDPGQPATGGSNPGSHAGMA